MPDSLDPSLLLVAEHDGVVNLTLDRPSAFNSLSLAMLDQLHGELARIAANDTARVLVLRGNGKAFCAGHDLKEMGEHRTPDDLRRLFGRCSEVMIQLTQLPVPVIAAVDGIATAAGCQLVAACDLAICTERSRFAASGVKYGLFCSTPMIALSRNVPRKPAMEMLLTGDFVDSERALAYGLVNQVVADAELETAVAAMVARLVDKPKATLALGKRAFYTQLEMGMTDAYAFATEVIVDNAMMDDFDEGLAAFREKRKPRWGQT
ncbi:MAG: enoyl-CoA hydratase [Geminicoccaceae bacterium]|nr:MAG: enoyl-CoA hydratase [Geminicoccaceae bacterium]